MSDTQVDRARILVDDSVYEDAILTVRDGRLYIQFYALDLPALTISLADIPQNDQSPPPGR